MKSNGEALRGILALKLSAVLVLPSGCFYDVSENGDEEALGAVSQAVNGANAIGVIPIGTDAEEGMGFTCPRESTSTLTPIAKLVTLFMDDEDDDNQDKLSKGWVAPSTSNPWYWFGTDGHNTTFRFCRVEGGLFLPKTTSPGDTANFYAVLSLGTSCPAGSTRVGYHIDNEDDQNINSSSGPFAPNTTDAIFSSTTLFFCVYRSLAFSMGPFPDLGAPYAVFHTWDPAKQPSWVMSKHAKYTDDEDDGNQNHVLTPNDPGVVAELQKMVRMSNNSTFSMARVR